ncbi:MAG: translation initiation factor 2 [Clostridiales bacterium]|jgi:hypothetical protein|nr:translation initiation factor 2 [Clostridiales bacterium]
MIKGITKRVIVVKSPDPKIFEEAIFIVRDEAASHGSSAEALLREAQKIANGYIGNVSKGLHRLPPIAYATAGAAITGLIWVLTVLLT